MEKYTTDESGNKMTYLIVPANHPTIPFPLNLQDRMQYIIQEIERETRTSVNPQIEIIQSQGDFDDIDYFYYRLIFNNMNRYSDIMRLYGGVQENDKWIIIIK
nr:ATP dependent RNA helicase [Mimivirus sp.]